MGRFWQNRFYSCPLGRTHAHDTAAYVELSPVRAGMAPAASDYPWSNASVHCGEGADAWGLLELPKWFERMPAKESKATLRAIAESDAPMERLRNHTRTGPPVGDDAFLRRVETFLGWPVRALPIGRQKSWAENKARHGEAGEDDQ